MDTRMVMNARFSCVKYIFHFWTRSGSISTPLSTPNSLITCRCAMTLCLWVHMALGKQFWKQMKKQMDRALHPHRPGTTAPPTGRCGPTLSLLPPPRSDGATTATSITRTKTLSSLRGGLTMGGGHRVRRKPARRRGCCAATPREEGHCRYVVDHVAAVLEMRCRYPRRSCWRRGGRDRRRGRGGSARRRRRWAMPDLAPRRGGAIRRRKESAANDYVQGGASSRRG